MCISLHVHKLLRLILKGTHGQPPPRTPHGTVLGDGARAIGSRYTVLGCRVYMIQHGLCFGSLGSIETCARAQGTASILFNDERKKPS